MSIVIASQTDISGGAARAAYRLHRALNQGGVTSQMLVRIKRSDDPTVEGPVSRLGKLSGLLRPSVGDALMRIQRTGNPNVHSGNWLPSTLADSINKSPSDLVNLHWVAGEMASIEDIGRIRKPIVWTLHDMWPFCGAEHYGQDGETARWRNGYTKANRLVGDRGLDLDRLVWCRKRRAWVRRTLIVAPSRWLADCARESALFHDWPVSVIPNVLDTSIFQPLNQSFSRQVLGLPNDRKIVLFGAMGGGRDLRKGYDLLLETLSRLALRVDAEDFLCVVFGQDAPQMSRGLPFPMRWMGSIHDDATLALLYNSADVMVVPSRQENLPQTATEPQACGCAVVAFDCTGLRDAVIHRETGYLAAAFKADDMAEGLHWVLEDEGRRASMGRLARERALQLWAPEVIVPQYRQIYEKAIGIQADAR